MIFQIRFTYKGTLIYQIRFTMTRVCVSTPNHYKSAQYVIQHCSTMSKIKTRNTPSRYPSTGKRTPSRSPSNDPLKATRTSLVNPSTNYSTGPTSSSVSQAKPSISSSNVFLPFITHDHEPHRLHVSGTPTSQSFPQPITSVGASLETYVYQLVNDRSMK